MAKTYKRLFGRIISFDNLLFAAKQTQRGKRTKQNVARFNFALESELLELQAELQAQNYRSGEYSHFYVYEPKKRLISAPLYRDRVVHHAFCNVVEPLFDRTFIYDSYACRKGKGTHRALDRTQSFLKANTYYLHGDIQKYFFSIEHNTLKELLRCKIEDEKALWLIDEIVGSVAQNSEGIPIGNLTSQFFANLYLNELDRFVKFNLRQRYYLRYMDDFLLFSNSRQKLQRVKREVSEFVDKRLHLRLHQAKSQIYKTNEGISFLGFRIFYNHRRLLKDNVRRFKKRLRRFTYLLDKTPPSKELGGSIPVDKGKVELDKVKNSVRCWVAHSKYANAKTLRFNIWNQLMKEDIFDSLSSKAPTVLGNRLKDILLDGVGIGSERDEFTLMRKRGK